MTTMIIDNKAGNAQSYENYKIDRRIYKTVDALKELAKDCMNEKVFKIEVYVNGEEILRVYNDR